MSDRDPAPTDLQLLQRHAREGDEAAFAEVVRRHLGLVHSAALRQVRSPQLAEEVASTTFQELARATPRLAPDTVVPAWLYAVTRRIALNALRQEARRRLREQAAHELATMNATAADWTAIAPLLDDAMHALDETDRTAVLLRYFENRSLREVGAALGTGEDAAQKRVSRAVERLREWFAARGVATTVAALTLTVSANASTPAPAGLAAAVTAAAGLTGTAVVSAALVTTTQRIAILTLQKALLALVIVAASAGAYVAYSNRADRGDNPRSLETRTGQVALPTATLAKSRAIALTGFQTEIKSAEEIILADSDIPFLAAQVIGRPVWLVKFSPFKLSLKSAQGRADLYQRDFEVVLDKKTGVLVSLKSTFAGSLPSGLKLLPPLTRAQADSQLKGVDGFTGTVTPSSEFPTSDPKFPFVDALDIIEIEANTVGAHPYEAVELTAFYVIIPWPGLEALFPRPGQAPAKAEMIPAPFWVIKLRGVPGLLPLPSFRSSRGSDESGGLSYLTIMVDEKSGKIVSSRGGSQPDS